MIVKTILAANELDDNITIEEYYLRQKAIHYTLYAAKVQQANTVVNHISLSKQSEDNKRLYKTLSDATFI